MKTVDISFCSTYPAQESIDELKSRMHARVREEYPDPEEDKPEEAREGYVPQAILEVMEEREKELAADKQRKKQKEVQARVPLAKS